MKLSTIKTSHPFPCSGSLKTTTTVRCCTTFINHPTTPNLTNLPKLTMSHQHPQLNGWEHLFNNPVDDHHQHHLHYSSHRSSSSSLSKRWKEYQGIRNWDGLLDPLDENLRREILRYGKFVDAAYKSFDFDPSSASYATCKFPKSTFFDRSGLPDTGYRITRNLRATSGITLPRWLDRGPAWLSTKSSWIGYVAVCQDKDEISRLGRRDVVISFRGTATPLEWLENLRATLTRVRENNGEEEAEDDDDVSMVESGFQSLYTSGGEESLQRMIRAEIARLLQSYGDEPLSLTITGHSLGAALATLAAYDVKTHFKRAPLVTVMSFGGPRVGNRNFRSRLERQGTKVLRIVNSDDVITKVPGFVFDERPDHVAPKNDVHVARWIQNAPWAYAEVGKELRLRSRDSPYLLESGFFDFATCHDLGTYLHLVENFVSSTCPFRATARKMLGDRSKTRHTARSP